MPPERPQRTLVFLSHGQGPHAAETEFAVLSAWRSLRDRSGVRLVLYTDRPAAYDSLPGERQVLSSEDLDRWRSDTGYLHRIKLQVVRDAVGRWGGSVVFVDSDTWFRRPADILFDRVGPGRVLLHVNEGRLRASGNPVKHRLAEVFETATLDRLDGSTWSPSADPTMWNSGVVGVHVDDAGVLDEALHLLDQLWDTYQGSEEVEQLAVGRVAEDRCRVRGCPDVVFHYWPRFFRDPWAGRLGGLLESSRPMPPDERAAWLHRRRPRPSPRVRAAKLARDALRAVGRDPRSPRSSLT